MCVKEAMNTTVRSIGRDRPRAEAAEIMKRFGIDHVIVVEHGAPIGILSDGDIARNAEARTVHDAMTRELVTIDTGETVRRAANMLRGHDIKSLVVTEAGKLAGIITSTDVLEIVGRT